VSQIETDEVGSVAALAAQRSGLGKAGAQPASQMVIKAWPWRRDGSGLIEDMTPIHEPAARGVAQSPTPPAAVAASVVWRLKGST